MLIPQWPLRVLNFILNLPSCYPFAKTFKILCKDNWYFGAEVWSQMFSSDNRSDDEQCQIVFASRIYNRGKATASWRGRSQSTIITSVLKLYFTGLICCWEESVWNVYKAANMHQIFVSLLFLCFIVLFLYIWCQWITEFDCFLMDKYVKNLDKNWPG